MYIKNLVMVGFKSFVDETKLEFERGLTAIVGPNGCGKSNICDAMRWVFGEQRAKHLRGGKMEELIFNGSESRKMVGMAEVSITMAGIGDAIAKPELSGYEEITVKRRVYRSGDSEYFINKAPCRLKDIIDLFLDTGISTRSFSIMEQEQVNRLITSKPLQRRYVIEEAAGVLKYKYRRNEALNKLESSQQNLLRISDIVKELESRLNSLKRQANKAERYKKYKAEMLDIGIALLSMEYLVLKTNLSGIGEESLAFQSKDVEQSTQISELKKSIECLRTETSENEKSHSELCQAEYEVRVGVEQAQERNSMLRKQIVETEENEKRRLEEADNLKREIVGLDGLNNERCTEITVQEEKLVVFENQFFEKKASLQLKLKSLEDTQASFEGSEKGLLSLIGEISNMKNRLTSIEARSEGIRDREERLLGESEETNRLFGIAQGKMKTITASLEDRIGLLEIKKETLCAITSDQAATEEELREVESVVTALKDTFSKKNALHESLLELKNRFEGFGDGVKSVMTHKANGDLNGIHGVLVDYIATAPEYEVAVETVLGEKLRGVIVDTPAEGVCASDLLKQNSGGKVVFIPSTLRLNDNFQYEGSGADGVIGKAEDLVTIKGEFQSAVQGLLNDVLIVRDAASGLALWQRNGIRCTIVTLEGEIIDPYGVVYGGKNGDSSVGLMAKNRQIQELKVAITDLREAVAKIEETKAQLKEKEALLAEQKKSLEYEIHELDVLSKNGQQELRRVSDESRRLENKLETLILENDQLAKEREKIDSESTELRVAIEKSEEQRAVTEGALSSRKEEAKNMRADIDCRSEEVTRTEVEITSLKGQIANYKADVIRIEREQESAKERISRMESELQNSSEKIKNHQETLEKGKNDISSLTEKKSLIENEIVMAKEVIRQTNRTLEEAGKELRSVEAENEKLRGAVASTNLKKSEIEMRIELLEKKAAEEYGLEETIPESSEEGFDEEKNRERLRYLRKEIDRYGDVNLTAITEYEDVKERYDFLHAQEEDLITSIKSLHQTIEKIDSTTRKLFKETFEKINENFKGIFRRLFRGGKAELVLIESDEMNEPGVDIFVQPPGKKLQNITLMSAGEKAMTAISILFSVFMVKPSPFCLLDEIDAPLDDANIGRFKDMLKEMSDKTQFVVITHNQKTMTFADSLYGITMEDHGVSKVLSVNMSENESVTIAA